MKSIRFAEDFRAADARRNVGGVTIVSAGAMGPLWSQGSSGPGAAVRPRRELRLGPDFLATISSVEGVDRSKVVAVTVEIITDLVNDLGSRELHPLREGDGGAARDVVRLRDGARCKRVALQRKTPSARRLHYWKVGDAIELSRVVKHDDMTS